MTLLYVYDLEDPNSYDIGLQGFPMFYERFSWLKFLLADGINISNNYDSHSDKYSDMDVSHK